MIVIYTQDETIFKDSADSAKDDFVRLYGEKLGAEAYAAVRNGRIGSSYRKYGGPLVKVVDSKEVDAIRTKEELIGMQVSWK